MNKKAQIESDDVFEFLKIGIAVIAGYIIIKALLNLDAEPNQAKCLCDCCENIIRLG